MPRRKASVVKKNCNSENFEWILDKAREDSTKVSRFQRKVSKNTLIIKPAPPKDDSSVCIGNLVIGLCCANDTSTDAPEDAESNEIVYVMYNDELKKTKLLIDRQLIEGLILQSKIYYDVSICEKTYTVQMPVYVTFLPEEKIYPKYASIIRKLLSHIYQRTFGYEFETREFQKRHNLDELYSAIASFRTHINDVQFDTDKDCPQLIPRLRPYQLKAVQWMLDREKLTENCERTPDPMYESIVLPNNDTVYYNEVTGHLTRVIPTVGPLPSGGILADEMGLGKTLEVLACILLNSRPKNQSEIDGREDDESDSAEEYEYPKYSQSLKRRKKPTDKKHSSVRKKKRLENHRSKFKRLVQCLCGESDYQGDEIQCVDCYKVQHLSCVGLSDSVDDYCCPQCYANKPLIHTRATLIISPKSISNQWLSEIKKHTIRKSLKVYVYRGISKDGYIYPLKLADHDIVLTTYNVLQSEIKFSEEESSDRSLRHAKRYHSPVTSMTMIKWWRVCLDEAQMVDSATSIVASMARLIPAVHRWAVSGTPAQRGINDFFGLIKFLGIEPYCDLNVWNKLLYYPYCYGDKVLLQKFLQKILWRTAKNDVIAEVNIPNQTEKTYWLKLSPTENFFYKKEHEMCLSSLQQRLQNFSSLDVTLDSLDRRILNKVMMPLLALRQACIHPHAVKGRYLTSKRNVVSMEDLLEALIDKNLNECEESLRVNIAVLNGLAGIHMLSEEWARATERYQDVLALIDQHKDRLKIDILPRLHTLHNLADVIAWNRPNGNVLPTLGEQQLREQAATLEEQYLTRKRAFVLGAEEDYKKLTDEASAIEQKFSSVSGAWLSELIDWIGVNDLTEDMMDKIQMTLVDNPASGTSIGESLTSSWTVIYQMSIWFDKISNSLQKLQKNFKDLKELSVSERNRFPESNVQDVINCHLRPVKNSNKKRKLCHFCKIEEEMKQYECHLFQISTKKSKSKRVIKDDDDEANKKMQGTWQRTQQEVIMRVLVQYGKQKSGPEDLIREGETHLEMYEVYKKQFKEMRRLWTYYSEQIAAQDELNMSKERFRLKVPNEEDEQTSEKEVVTLKNLDYSIENKLDTINILEPHMVDITFDLLTNDREAERADFTRKLGTLNYLETLRKRRYAGQKPDPCPICTNPLKDHWSVFTCGHSFCLDCMHHLLEQCPNAKSVSCSVCRQVQSYQDISYVKLSEENLPDSSETSIKGSFSTKVEAITRCVLQLIKNDPDVKVLVFSTWEQVLQVIGESFSMNNISYCRFSSSNHENLIKFQDFSKKVTALLLPIRAGAKGLNLIEATHVLLVEPLMNPGEEMQAIGRVHRIGQTKPTVVHRFLVSDSIEESIYKSVSSKSDKWNNDAITLRSLQELFRQSAQSSIETSTTV